MLTNKENEVLGLLSEGYSNEELAELLHVSKSTVKKHLEHIFEKIGVCNRVQATIIYNKEKSSELIKMYNQCTPKQQQEIVKILKNYTETKDSPDKK